MSIPRGSTCHGQPVSPKIMPSRLALIAVLSLSFQVSVHGFSTRAYSRTFRPVVGSHTSTALQVAKDTAEDVCTIQILMSDTGGGHRASANALRDAFDILYPGKIQCDIVDIYTDYGPFWPYNDYVRLYKLMAEYSFLWDAFYRFGSTDFGLYLNELLLETFCFDAFKECINRPSGSTTRRADMVVSVHPLCQDLPLKILSDLDSNGKTRAPEGRTTPFATVVTDLGGAHPTWFNAGVDKCFVPSDILYQCARKRNVQPSQLVQYGLPIRKGFWSLESLEEIMSPTSRGNIMSRALRSLTGPTNDSVASDVTTTKPTRSVLREKLGLDLDLPAVLVVGGGDGMGGIVEIARSLGDKLGSDSATPAYQMVVVCGNNQKAKKSLSSINWGKGVKVQVQGFVNNMDEWMKASDALVTKAGPGTIAEASICGLPCMLFSYLPGQEEGNVPFVENAGFGKYSGDPVVIANTVSSWLASPEKMAAMREAALEAARPSATLDIARDLGEMVFAIKKQEHVQLVTV